jgi:hypothetical protein
MTGSGMATLNGCASGPPYQTSGPAGYGNVPVNLLYKAVPALPADDYAVLVNGNNITIQGTGTGENGTTLVAFNRATTILYIGSGVKRLSSDSIGTPVSNILITNLTFQGNPTTNYLGSYDTNGLMRACKLGWTYQDPLGALVTLGGYQDPNNGAISWSQNLAVKNCAFYVPSSVGVSLLWDKDVVITNCSFNYFTNNMPPALADDLWAWCGILSLGENVEDVAVLDCAFNGNASMQSAGDYAADGLVWLSNGGKWLVANCAITNYHFEAVNLNAGPYSVVNNTYTTLTTNIASCALHTMHNYPTNNLTSANSIYSAFCFVGNTVGTVGSLGGGLLGIRDPGLQTGPYTFVMSANQFKLTTNVSGSNPAEVLVLASSKAVTATGNQITQAHRAIHYGSSSASAQNFSLAAQGNDFANVTGSSFFVQDGYGKLTNAVFLYNRLGSGSDEWVPNTNGTHIALELSSTQPALFLEGNQFVCLGVNSPLVAGATVGGNAFNTWDGWLGMEFSVGGTELVATFLGRWVLAGNQNSHTVKLVDASGYDLASGSVTVTTAGQSAGTYAYAQLSTPVVLQPNTTYSLVSQETNNGDYWYWSTPITPSGVTPGGSVYSANTTPLVFGTQESGNHCYGPLNLLCFLIYPAVGSPKYSINSPNQYADGTFSYY